MGTQVEDTGTPGRARAGTLTVIGTMAAIAVVSVTAVVAWARLAQPAASEGPAGVEQEVPAVLADGSQPAPVPAAIAAAVDLPVVGAAKLDELSDEMLGACTEGFEGAGDAGEQGGLRPEYAFVTPDGVVASVTGKGELAEEFGMGPGGEQPTGVRFRCDLQLEEGSVTNRGGGGGFEPIFPDQPSSGGFSSSCCDEQGLANATATVQVPVDAAWLLHDRGTWYLGYEVGGLENVGVSWRYRENRFGQGGPPMSTVLFVGEDGSIVAETTAGGQF